MPSFAMVMFTDLSCSYSLACFFMVSKFLGPRFRGDDLEGRDDLKKGGGMI